MIYKIKAIIIDDYDEIINLWKNTDGVGLSEKDDLNYIVSVYKVIVCNIAPVITRRLYPITLQNIFCP